MIGQEPVAVRDRYGRHAFGQSLLLARRLVEAGVPVVQANMGRVQNWDTHGDNFGKLRDRLLPPLDQGVAAPAFGSGQVDAWGMWSPAVDIARSQFKAHNIFLEGRDCAIQPVKPRQCAGFPNTWNFPGWREACEAVPVLLQGETN